MIGSLDVFTQFVGQLVGLKNELAKLLDSAAFMASGVAQEYQRLFGRVVNPGGEFGVPISDFHDGNTSLNPLHLFIEYSMHFLPNTKLLSDNPFSVCLAKHIQQFIRNATGQVISHSDVVFRSPGNFEAKLVGKAGLIAPGAKVVMSDRVSEYMTLINAMMATRIKVECGSKSDFGFR